jgi:hypothetical protein
MNCRTLLFANNICVAVAVRRESEKIRYQCNPDMRKFRYVDHGFFAFPGFVMNCRTMLFASKLCVTVLALSGKEKNPLLALQDFDQRRYLIRRCSCSNNNREFRHVCLL